MIENADIKKLGIGSLALAISLFAIMFSFTAIGDKSIGQYILNALGIRFSYGLISISLFVLSVFIGYRYKGDRYAKIGGNISIILLIICTLLIIASKLF